MPYRRQHNCTINKDIVNVTETRTVKTKWGDLKAVYGRDSSGKYGIRAIRIPATVPVQVAQNICKIRGGQFQPATPMNPKRELLSELEGLSKDRKREIFKALVEDFEMGFKESKLADWSRAHKNDLPDSAFLIILPGGHKDETGRTVPRSLRRLPYKNARGQIDKNHVRNALARINQVDAPASIKRAALRKLIRIARALGMETKEASKFKMSDLEFYLEQLEKLERS